MALNCLSSRSKSDIRPQFNKGPFLFTFLVLNREFNLKLHFIEFYLVYVHVDKVITRLELHSFYT